MKRFYLLLILSFAVGCSSVVVSRGTPAAPDAIPERVYRLSTFLFGTVSRHNVVEAEACPGSRIDWMRLRMSGGDVGLAIVTLGIYTPQHVEIVCGKN